MSEHANLAAALVAALAELTVVEKGRTADAGSYKYDYADLGDIVKLTRPKLAEHGIVALTPVEEHGPGLKCTVVLLHSSGEKMEFGPFPFPFGRDAQATGSLVTYHRRYALSAALGIAAGDDDDGATAQAQQPKAQAAPVPERLQALIASIEALPTDKRDQLDATIAERVWNGETVPLTELPEPWWEHVEKWVHKLTEQVPA